MKYLLLLLIISLTSCEPTERWRAKQYYKDFLLNPTVSPYLQIIDVPQGCKPNDTVITAGGYTYILLEKSPIR